MVAAAAAKGPAADEDGKGQFAGVMQAFAVGERPAARSRDMLTLDSAATSSLFNDARCFDSITHVRGLVENANRELKPMVIGVGRARYTVKVQGGGTVDICVENAKYAPECWML